MSRSFSVEDLLDEVEKICYDASGAKVRDNRTHTACLFVRLFVVYFLHYITQIRIILNVVDCWLY